MNLSHQRELLSCAVAAGRSAGALMRRHWHSGKKITAATQHDIKLELDVRCQQRIERLLLRADPSIAVLGEEGIRGDPGADYRWVIDPIDGTVNFSYGIPHACVSIALQARKGLQPLPTKGRRTWEDFETLLGVVYDPFCDELWTGLRGGPARLNGKPIRVSCRRRLSETIISIGFAKDAEAMKTMLPTFNQLIGRVRKVRTMGAAALGLAYVASGRMDCYLEYRLSLWDIAAGGLLIECAGGEFWRQATPQQHVYRVVASNGLLRSQLRPFLPDPG